MVADACFHAARFGDSVAVDKVDVLGCNVFGKQSLVCRKNNSIVLGVNRFNVHRLRQRQAQAFALAYGVMDNTLVSAKHVACLVYEVAGLKFSSQACFDKISVGACLYKADILTVMLLSVDEAMLFGNFAYLCLMQAAEWEHSVCQLLLREGIKHVALVLQRINCLTQQVTAFGFIIADLRIVAGDNIVTAKLLCAHEKLVEFQITVAVNAGVRCSAVNVSVYETVDNVAFKAVGKVENVVRHAKAGCYAAGICYIVDRAAAVGFGNADILVGKKLHSYTGAFVALLQHHQCGNAGINAAAHSD